MQFSLGSRLLLTCVLALTISHWTLNDQSTPSVQAAYLKTEASTAATTQAYATRVADASTTQDYSATATSSATQGTWECDEEDSTSTAAASATDDCDEVEASTSVAAASATEECDDEASGSSSAGAASTTAQSYATNTAAASASTDASATNASYAASATATSTSTHKVVSQQASTSSSSGKVYRSGSGQATWFTQGGNAGSCGTVHSDSDMIAALQWDTQAAYNAAGGLCGKKVHITTSTGKQLTVTVADSCIKASGCQMASGDVDLSVGAFTKIASQSQGTFKINWTVSNN